MTRVDFYILQDVELDALHRFACRLATKAAFGGNEVFVHTEDDKSAHAFDELLWEYPEQRFVPHGIVGSAAHRAPIHIGWQEPAQMDDVLINLTADVPGFFGRFDRVAEIVVRSTRDDGRARYKFYRDRGFPLFHHDLEDWETP